MDQERELGMHALELFDMLPDPMWIYDRSTLQLLEANQAASRVFGYTRDQLLQRSIIDLRPPEDAEAIRQAVMAISDGETEGGVWRIRAADGRIRHVDFHWRTITFKNQPAVLASARDVTKLVQTEQEKTRLLEETYALRNEAEQAAIHFRSLFEAVPGKFLVLEPINFEIVAVSDAYLAATMRRREELKGKLLFQAFPEDPTEPDFDGVSNLRASLERVKSLCMADQMAVQRYPIPRPVEAGGGFEERYWNAVNTPVLGPSGELAFIIHRVEDVTELMLSGKISCDGQRSKGLAGEQSNQAALDIILRSQELRLANTRLKEQQANLRTAQRLLGLGIWKMNLATGKLSWSDNIYGMLRVSRTEFQPDFSGYLSLLHPQDRPAFQEQFQAFMRSDHIAYSFEHRIIDTHGELVYVRGSGERTQGPDGPQLVGVIQDVTEQVHMRERTESLARSLADTLENMGDAFYLLDHQLHFAFLNGKAAELLDCKRDDVVGQLVWDAFPQARDTELYTCYPQALQTGQTRRLELFYPPVRRWFTIEVHPVPDGLAVYFRDITEQRDLEARLQQAQKLEAVGQLTGGIAHDFNNILTVILGNAEMLADMLEPGQTQQMAAMAVSAAERGADLTNRLLAFARRQALEPKVVDMNQLIAGMDALLRHVLNEDIETEVARAAGLSLVEIDPGQLETAILNLAINARDAMPHGGRLTLETARTRLDADYARANPDVTPGDYVLLSVSDTGCGMGQQVLQRAFEPFFTTKDVGKGSGLGLSMVYGFVRQSGGHAKIYSEPGEGTSVKLYFPASSQRQVHTTASVQTNDLPTGSEHILVVEDDKLVQTNLVSQLIELGYKVSCADNGPDALLLLQRHSDIALLFTDVVMPGGMNGRQLADRARTLRPDLPVLFTSGYTENAIVHHGRLDQGVHLLGKPYRRQDLAQKVRRVLSGPV